MFRQTDFNKINYKPFIMGSSFSSRSFSPAAPLTAEKFDNLLSLVSSYNKDEIPDLLYSNITEISKKALINMINRCYDANEIIDIVNKWYPKCKQSDDVIKAVCDRLMRYDSAKMISFITHHKNDIDPQAVLKNIKSKTVRNSIRKVFDMSLEHVEDRPNGVEIFGAFVSGNEIDHKNYTHTNKGVTYDVTLSKSDGNQVNYDIKNSSSSGWGSVGGSFSLDGVWIIDTEGNLYKE